jgi:two-component system, cell cycle sensor histidine kinase and response regulator CckA
MKDLIPTSRLKIVPHEPEAKVVPPVRQTKEIVLVIEDDAAVREIVEKILGFLGYGVLLAESGAAGLAIYREQQSRILIVLTDIKMPVMPGGVVMQALRAINPRVRIVAMSGVVGEKERITEEPGLTAFVHKPMMRKDLVQAFQYVLQPPAAAAAEA